MKLLKTEAAVGHVLCHDMTQIIKDQYKDARFLSRLKGPAGKRQGRRNTGSFRQFMDIIYLFHVPFLLMIHRVSSIHPSAGG